MTFREIFRFECAYQLRHVSTWLCFAALFALAFLFGGSTPADGVWRNSPFLIAFATVLTGAVWLLIAAPVAGEAAARDAQTRMDPLIYTAPVGKAGYLGGRFLAAFVLNALILLAVPLGLLLASALPGVAAGSLGPFRPSAYLTAYGCIALPNAFVATAIQFSAATLSRRPLASYLASVLLLVGSAVGSLAVAQLLGRRELIGLLDLVGLASIVLGLEGRWTPVEMNTRLVALEGWLLANRLLWLAGAAGVLTCTYLRFGLAHPAGRTWRGGVGRSFARLGAGRREAPLRRPTGRGRAGSAPTALPRIRRAFGVATSARQTLAIARASFLLLAQGRGGLALLGAIALLVVALLPENIASMGTPLRPETGYLLTFLTAPLANASTPWVIIPLLIILYAGELVWREREVGLAEIADAAPVPEWAHVLGRVLGLGLVLVAWMAFLTTAAVLVQARMGYGDFELGLYLRILFGLQLADYLLFALLAFAAHVLVHEKRVGHLVAILAYLFIAFATRLGIAHHLLIYGSDPGWSYTAMRGFGPSLGPWLWFKLYWAAWATLLAVAARLAWVRGRERGIGMRLRAARRRLTHPTAWIGAAAAGLILALGGFIFYNTSVLNAHHTAPELAGRRAEYERRYGRYGGLPQPRLTATALHVEIYPARREAEIRGTYHLVNGGAVAIDTIHVATVPGVATGTIAFDRAAASVLADDDLGHRIYALAEPLQPGDALRLDFRVRSEPRGFRGDGVDTAVVANGTHLTSREWLPAIGYQPDRELTGAAERRAHRLAPRPPIAPLDDVAARQDRNGGVAFEAVMGTDEGQVAVAPGAPRRTWTEGGRRYFHYATDGPIGDEYALFSADYAVHEARWNAVIIRIFHHPGHTAHLDRMVRSIRASLDYYTGEFGPYRYGHLSVVERPGDGTGMHADATMLTYAEGFALLNPADDAESLDLPFAVVAHEMAHQWTVPYARVEGAPVLSESVAWYYAMKVVEHDRGRDHLRRLLSFMRRPQPYPPIRRGAPLLRGLDPYLSYRKGPLALYALSEYIGEERVNAALRRLLERHRPDDAPLATTRDLYRELGAVTPDPLQYLLHDLFAVNAHWELATERATAEQTAAGDWLVTLDVRARKVVVDEAGVETLVPMDEWVEIGIPARPGGGEDPDAPLRVQRQRIRSGEQTVTMTVPTRPARAGIDPRHLLIDLDADNNIAEVQLAH